MDEKDQEIHNIVKDSLHQYIKPLTTDDFKLLKDVIEHHTRVRWLLNSARVWLIAAMSIVTFLTIGLDGVKSILRKLIS